MEQKNVIVDCDAGIDDALALILLLNAHKTKKIKILAVTCVYGNTTVNNVVRNVCRTMNTCQVTEVRKVPSCEALKEKKKKPKKEGQKPSVILSIGSVNGGTCDISRQIFTVS